MSKHRPTGRRVRKSARRVEPAPAVELPRWNRRTTTALLVVTICSLVLNLTGLNWGQPGSYSWQPDSIAGMPTVRHTQYLFGPWQHKYPRVHFIVNAAVYKLFMSGWRQYPGQQDVELLNAERASTLIIVSRVVSALMGAGAVIAVFLAVRVLFGDDLAAFLAGLGLAFSMLFVFYNHLGNVDAACVFWFAWSLYWAVKAVYTGKWRHWLLLGVFGALAVGTKEPAAGYIVGLAVAMWLGAASVARTAGKSWKAALMSVFRLKAVVAAVVMVFLFALIDDLLTTPSAFFKRMDFWFKVGVEGYNQAFAGQWSHLLRSLGVIYYSLGWPLLAAVVVTSVYCVWRYRYKAAFALMPLAVFYVVVIARTGLSVPRYFLPGLPPLMLLVGKGCADWLRYERLPKAAKVVPLAAVYVLSLLYCIGLDLEMVTDSRYSAEKWLASRVQRSDGVACLSIPAYAPRVQRLNCHYRDFRRIKPEYDKGLEQIRPLATYIVVSEKECAGWDQEFLRALLAGEKGYEEVARFSNKYLYPRRTVFGLAGWPVTRSPMISPDTIILQRR